MDNKSKIDTDRGASGDNHAHSFKELLSQLRCPKNWKCLFCRYRELIMYIIFGVITTIVSFVTYYLFRYAFPNAQSVPRFLRFLFKLAGIFGTDSNTALPVILSWFCAVAFAYITNRFFVFKVKAYTVFGVIREILLFYGGRFMTLLVDMLIMFLLVDLPGRYGAVYEFCIRVFSAFVVTVLNYFISKIIIFKKKT